MNKSKHCSKKYKWINFQKISILMLVAALLFSTGCDGSGSFFPGVQRTDVKTKTSGDISFAISSYATLNPFLSKDEDIYYLEKLIYDGLIRLNGEYMAEPGLASSWSYDEAGESMTFQLKSEALWHDGKKVTADDVVFTIETLLRTKGTNQSLYSQYVSNIKSVKKQSENSVTVFFITPKTTGAENFLFPIIPKHQFRSVNEVYSKKDDFIPIGTGAYQVDEISPVHISLVPNQQYHGVATPSNKLYFKCIPDKLSAIELFRIYDINCMISKETDRGVAFAGKDLNVIQYPSGEAEIVGFNFQNAFLADEKVRRAVAYCLDIDEIIETAYMGNGLPSQNLFPINYYGDNPAEMLQGYNIEEGDRILKEAGYYDINKDFKIDDMEGENISLKIIVNADDEPRRIVAEMLKGGLEKLNISSYIVLMDWESYVSAISLGEYDLFIGGFSLSDRIDLNFMLNSDVNNPVKFKNTSIDTMLAKLKYSESDEAKKETFGGLRSMLGQQIPYYCLLYKTYSMLTTSTMTGNMDVLWFDPYRNCTEWQYSYDLPPGS